MTERGHSGLKERFSGWLHPAARQNGAGHEFSPEQSGDDDGQPAVCAMCGKPFDSHDPVHLRKQNGRHVRVCVDCHGLYGSMSSRRGS